MNKASLILLLPLVALLGLVPLLILSILLPILSGIGIDLKLMYELLNWLYHSQH